jgi:hypothetical protein
MCKKYLSAQIVLILLLTGCTIIDSHREVHRTNSDVIKVDIVDKDSTKQLNPYQDNISFKETNTSQNGQTNIEGEGVVTGSDGSYEVVTDVTQVSENHFKIYVEARKPVVGRIFAGGTTMAMEVFPYRVKANLTEPFRLDVYEKSSHNNYSVRRITRGY